MNKEIEELFSRVSQLKYDDSSGMIRVGKMMGPGFFPGCCGTYDINSVSCKKTVMVLGQDFDTETNHKKLTEKGEVDSNATWRNLKKLLEDIQIDIHDCFFTNVYMGLRKEGLKNTGKSPAAKSPEFVKECIKFFRRKLEIIQPEVVLVLGVEPAKFLADVFQEFHDWKKINTLKSIYQDKGRAYQDIKFNDNDVRFLLVIHPSMSNTNRTLIFGKGNKGEEVRLLKEKLVSFYIKHTIKMYKIYRYS